MAIEFDCPYCTATIRVPDAYGGKQGRCPKCDTRLLVPMVVRPGSTTAPEAAFPTTDPVADRPGPVIPETEAFSVKPPVRSVRRRSSRRRPSRALVIGIPTLGFLVLLAIIAFSVTGNLPELSGELTATRLDVKNLPKVTIPWSDTRLSEDDREILRNFLSTTPETMSSQIMTCRFIGTNDGIEVQLTAGSDNDWFMVDTTTSKPLALWLKKERSHLNQKRMQILHSTLASYCRDKLAQIAGEPVAIDAVAVRDNVGINACGGALSFSVEAIADNKLVPCSYEDTAGKIYFCLPAGIQSFQIKGRTLPDQTKPFGGEFIANVGGFARPAANSPAAAEKAETETFQPSDAMPVDDDSMSMKNDLSPASSNAEGMPAEMSDGEMSDKKMSGGEMSEQELSDEKMSKEKMSDGKMMKPSGDDDSEMQMNMK